MKKVNPSNKIFVRKSLIKNAGKGVFAGQLIKKGKIIEICPVIEVSLKDPANDDNGILVDYFFYFGDDLAVALGFGSIYNHSYNPNATYEKNLKDKTIDFSAIKDIKPGEEIAVNYNFGDPNDTSKPPNRGIPKFRGM